MTERLPRSLTINESATRIGVSRRTVERYISDGKLVAYRQQPGNRVAVTEASIDAFLTPALVSGAA